MQSEGATQLVKRHAIPLEGAAGPFDDLVREASESRVVLLGEASHGTKEFYEARAEITRLLIEREGFDFVAVEADWPDAFRVNLFVKDQSDDDMAEAALADFTRFPRWMWRNEAIEHFVSWLNRYNRRNRAPRERVGFYGLDLYSLHSSVEAILHRLDEVDPAAAARARERYGCFDQFGPDVRRYGYQTGLGLSEGCESEVVEQLAELQRRRLEQISLGEGGEALLDMEQNSRLVRDAERYYRAMFRSNVESWNLRDEHMAESLDVLLSHHDRPGRPAKAVVWAHNSHIGDARATEMSERGETNLGALVRQKYGRGTYHVGFTTHHGWVTAASEWDGPALRRKIRPALRESYESLFHETGLGDFLLFPHREKNLLRHLMQRRLERAIGVIYLPHRERLSHYFAVNLPEQFNAVIHLDETSAVIPLDADSGWADEDPAQTLPFAM